MVKLPSLMPENPTEGILNNENNKPREMFADDYATSRHLVSECLRRRPWDGISREKMEHAVGKLGTSEGESVANCIGCLLPDELSRLCPL